MLRTYWNQETFRNSTFNVNHPLDSISKTDTFFNSTEALPDTHLLSSTMNYDILEFRRPPLLPDEHPKTPRCNNPLVISDKE